MMATIAMAVTHMMAKSLPSRDTGAATGVATGASSFFSFPIVSLIGTTGIGIERVILSPKD